MRARRRGRGGRSHSPAERRHSRHLRSADTSVVGRRCIVHRHRLFPSFSKQNMDPASTGRALHLLAADRPNRRPVIHLAKLCLPSSLLRRHTLKIFGIGARDGRMCSKQQARRQRRAQAKAVVRARHRPRVRALRGTHRRGVGPEPRGDARKGVLGQLTCACARAAAPLELGSQHLPKRGLVAGAERTGPPFCRA